MAQAIIAVRGGSNAKSRCADALSSLERDDLTAAMLEDMLSAVAACPEVSTTWVVTPTSRLAALALRRGARVISQGRPSGLNAAFRLAIAEVSDRAPYDFILMMPGDLPLLAADDLAAATLMVRTHAVVLAPALDGGTGLLALRAGAALPPSFGEQSFRRHVASARRLGVSAGVIAADSFCRDIDRPEDFASVLEHGPATAAAVFLRERLSQRIRS